MNILLTIVAAIIYTLGAYCMKQSNGFTQLTPALLVFVLFCVGATVQMFAMRQQEMTGLYLIFLGIEAFCAFFLGAFLLGEAITWQKVIGGIIVGAGIFLLQQ